MNYEYGGVFGSGSFEHITRAGMSNGRREWLADVLRVMPHAVQSLGIGFVFYDRFADHADPCEMLAALPIETQALHPLVVRYVENEIAFGSYVVPFRDAAKRPVGAEVWSFAGDGKSRCYRLQRGRPGLLLPSSYREFNTPTLIAESAAATVALTSARISAIGAPVIHHPEVLDDLEKSLDDREVIVLANDKPTFDGDGIAWAGRHRIEQAAALAARLDRHVFWAIVRGPENSAEWRLNFADWLCRLRGDAQVIEPPRRHPRPRRRKRHNLPATQH